LAVALYVPAPVLVKVIAGVACWMGLASGHFWIWRNFIERFTDHVLAPTRFRQGADAVVGQTGQVRVIDGRRMVAVQGDLWVFEGPEDLPDGARVQVVGQNEGTLRVKPHWEG
jgi:membrane protein implicated in regulation of membrane protease activity